MTKVSIVVLNWNRAQDTTECLKSINELLVTSYELQILVVDNGSTDNSVNRFKQSLNPYRFKNLDLRLKNLKIIENKENLGYAGGNNVGIRQALEDGADFVLVLNNDTLVDKNLVVAFLEAAGRYEDAGVFSPKIYFAKGFEFHKGRYKENELGRVIWSAGGTFDWDNVLGSNHGVDEVDSGQFDKKREIDFATGAAMFIRREVLEQTGLFNEKYFMYLEDVEFCLRAKKAGWKILYVPTAKLWHKVAQSSKIGGGLNDYYTTRNRLLFGMKYVSVRARVALLRESFKLLLKGRKWQRRGVIDFYLHRLDKGSWQAGYSAI